MEYGYINEYGYLTSKIIEDIVERYIDENGELKERIITAEIQVENLSKNGWKPVISMDESKRDCEEGYYVRVTPYDAGDNIDYNYEKKFDIQKVKKEIQELKDALSAGDYQITKCYEASLLGQGLPYNVTELHAHRQEVRNKINELESLLA